MLSITPATRVSLRAVGRRWLFPLIAWTLVSGCAAAYLIPGVRENNHGIEHMAKGDYDSAIREFDSAIEANPRVPVFYLNRGAAYFRQRKYDQAIEDFDRALALKANYVAAFTDRGNAYLFKGDQERAILEYSQAIKLMPEFYPAFINRAKAYSAKGDYDHALDDYNRALELSPDPPRPLIALDRNQEVTWDKPDPAGVLNSRCWIRAAAGREFEAALSDCNESLKRRPNSAATLDSRAFVYFRMDQFDKAISDASAAIGLDPNKAHSLFVRGLAKRRLGDIAGSDHDLEVARAIDPGVDSAYAKMGVKP